MPSITGNVWGASSAATASAIAPQGYGIELPIRGISWLLLTHHYKGDQNQKKYKEWGYTVDNFSDKEFEATKIKDSSTSPTAALRYGF